MKKIICILAISLLAVSLFGCSIGVKPSDGSLSSSFSETKEWVYNEAIDTAFELYYMFDVCSPDVDTEYSYESNGYEYYRIADERFLNYSDLEKSIRSVFSAEIADRLLATTAYIEVNGYTYLIPFARGTDSSVYEVAFGGANHVDENTVTYTASVTYDDDYDGLPDSNTLYVFKQEKIDGNLVFTEFPFFW